MRESQENYVAQQLAKSERNRSVSSDRRHRSHRSHRESGSEMNDRDSSNEKNKSTGRQSREQIMMKDQSAQAFGSINQNKSQASILKQSTMKSKVAYHSTILDESIQKQSRRTPDNSSPMSRTLEESFRQKDRQTSQRSRTSNYNTEKSFRIPQNRFRMSKKDAATVIQKWVKRYLLRKSFLMYVKRDSLIKRKTLFRATVRGETLKILTCSVKMTRRGRITGLTFVITGNQRIEIDLSEYNVDEDQLKEKVLHIIREALAADDLYGAIRASFQSPIVKEILECDEFSADNFQGSILSQSFNNFVQEKELKADTESEEHVQQPVYQPPATTQIVTTSQRVQPVEHREVRQMSRQEQIDAEIELIRKKCDIKYRVELGDVNIKSYCHERFGDQMETEESQVDRHMGLDSDDENQRRIMINSVDVKRKRKGDVGVIEQEDQLEQDIDDYELNFNMGEKVKPFKIEKKLSIWQIVKIQSRIRGFLARRRANANQKVLVNKIIKKDDNLIRFMLVKNADCSYALSAQTQMGNKIKKTVPISSLPFTEDEASDQFEEHLLFQMNDERITQLELFGFKKLNPFDEAPAEDHLFILDYKKTQRLTEGEKLIKSWRLRDTYPCELFECVDKTGTLYYKAVVTHLGKSDYLKLRQLPTEMIKMAYYLNNMLQVQLTHLSQIQYLYMNQMKNKRQFQRELDDLARRYFGMTIDGLVEQGPPRRASSAKGSDRSKGMGRMAQAVGSKIMKRQMTAIPDDMLSVKDFEIERNGFHYIVEIYDETRTKGRYQIHVCRRDNLNDKDRISVTQITLYLDDLVEYLKQNLNVYVHNDTGKINFLSLAGDAKLFSQRNLQHVRNVRESLSANRESQGESQSSSPNRNSQWYRGKGSAAEGSSQGGSYRRQQSGASSRYASKDLREKLPEFHLERNNTRYKVDVKEHKIQDGLPLQINVTNVDDPRDQRYMKLQNQDNLNDQDLRQLIESRLMVYTKFDNDLQRSVVDYVSISQRGDNYRQSSTHRVSDASNSISKKNLVQSRANKANKPSGQYIAVDSKFSHRTANTVNLGQDDSISRTYDSSIEPDWPELARQQVQVDGVTQDIILCMKNVMANRNIGSRSQDFYKIVVMDQTSFSPLGEVMLSPQLCNKLLNISFNDIDRQSPLMTALQLSVGISRSDPNQTEGMKRDCSYERNSQKWDRILRHAGWYERERNVKFDIWGLCQDDQELEERYNVRSKPPKKVGIQTKLQHRRENSAKIGSDNDVNARGSQRESMRDSQDSRMVDGGVEGSLDDTINSADRNRPPPYKIVRKSDYQQQQAQALLSPNSSHNNDQEVFMEEETLKIRPSFVSTLGGEYYRLQVFADASNYYVTLFEKTTRKSLCTKQIINPAFIDQVVQGGMDKLSAVKSALEHKIRSQNSIKDNHGLLDLSIFEN